MMCNWHESDTVSKSKYSGLEFVIFFFFLDSMVYLKKIISIEDVTKW